MSEPEFPLCPPDDPRVPVVLDMLRKSQLMGGTFTLDARRVLAALDREVADVAGFHAVADEDALIVACPDLPCLTRDTVADGWHTTVGAVVAAARSHVHCYPPDRTPPSTGEHTGVDGQALAVHRTDRTDQDRNEKEKLNG